MKVAASTVLLILTISCSKKVVNSTEYIVPVKTVPDQEVSVVKEEPHIPEPVEEKREEKTILVYFQFDSYEITDSEKSKLNEVDNTAKLTGGTCDIGGEEYNYTLGMKRAIAVKEILNERGVIASTSSVGENEPISEMRE